MDEDEGEAVGALTKLCFELRKQKKKDTAK